MLSSIHKLWMDEEAMTTVEYALLLVLIVSVGILAWQSFGQTLSARVDTFNSQLP